MLEFDCGSQSLLHGEDSLRRRGKLGTSRGPSTPQLLRVPRNSCSAQDDKGQVTQDDKGQVTQDDKGQVAQDDKGQVAQDDKGTGI